MTWKTILLVLLVFIVSAAGGFLYRDYRDKAIQETGWCCVRAGEACQKSASVDTCASQGGVLFDLSPFVCNAACGVTPPTP
jgi:hypothetical protein